MKRTLPLHNQLLAVLAIAVGLASCTVQTRNHTPDEFPWVTARDWPQPDEVLYPNATVIQPQGIIVESTYSRLLGSWQHRRFWLETKPGRHVIRSTVKPTIKLDGVPQTMFAHSYGLWYFDAPNRCKSPFQYSFEVTWSTDFGSNERALLDDGGKPFEINVSQFRQFVWYELGNKVLAGDGEIAFSDGTYNLPRTVVVQNLHPDPIDVRSVSFVGGLAGNSHFQLIPPKLPVTLACGESITFQVVWTPIITVPYQYPLDLGAINVFGYREPTGFSYRINLRPVAPSL